MTEVYYIYHIPGKKIGVTRDLNNRVTLVQGYKPKEYEVLDSSSDIIEERNRASKVLWVQSR